MKKIKDLKKWIDDYEALEGAVDELNLSPNSFQEEAVSEAEVDAAYAAVIARLEDMELRNMLRREEDSMSAVLKIQLQGRRNRKVRTGPQCFMRMYMRWGENRGYKVSIANLLEGDEAGIKNMYA